MQVQAESGNDILLFMRYGFIDFGYGTAYKSDLGLKKLSFVKSAEIMIR